MTNVVSSRFRLFTLAENCFNMALPPMPPQFKPIQHYLKTAAEHDKRDPVVAYYCTYISFVIFTILESCFDRDWASTAVLMSQHDMDMQLDLNLDLERSTW